MIQAKKLQRKSIDELKQIGRLRRIKNSEKLTKEDLIISLLKSESSALEHNFKKHLNNNNNNNNNNNTDDDDNDSYDDKIRGKIRDINVIFSRLGNIVANKYRKIITKELHEKEQKRKLSDKEEEEVYDYLLKLVKSLNEKERYQYHDRDDLDYYGIKDRKFI